MHDGSASTFASLEKCVFCELSLQICQITLDPYYHLCAIQNIVIHRGSPALTVSEQCFMISQIMGDIMRLMPINYVIKKRF